MTSPIKESIDAILKALETLKKPSPWSSDIKATGVFPDTLFLKRDFEKNGLPNFWRKTGQHVLTNWVATTRYFALRGGTPLPALTDPA